MRNGIHAKPVPLLRKLDSIECSNALVVVAPDLLEDDRPAKPSRSKTLAPVRCSEAEWPKVDFIVGNPPFMGIRVMRTGLGDELVEQLFATYDGRVSREADLVCYWFEKARAALKADRVKRVGLVTTNSIRGGANRKVLDAIASESRIFEAWSDEPWVVDGASVRVSLVCFGNDSDPLQLDGKTASQINSDLTPGSLDLTKSKNLFENSNIASNGISKKGKFEIDGLIARAWIQKEYNPNGLSNANILAPWRNGEHVTRGRFSDKWIVNFSGYDERDASQFQAPFEYLREFVKPFRDRSNSTLEKRYWWRLARPASGLFEELRGLQRFIVTPEVSKYRIFVWLESGICPDKNLVVIARDDDVCFGVLHTRFHRAWSLRLGTSLEDRPRYTCSTIFDTFPFPEGLTPNIPAIRYAADPRAIAIAKAAKRLDDLRNAWLNPPDLVRIEPEVVAGYPDRILPKDSVAAANLRERTLTNLYNQNPQWLLNAHRDLDAAVATAYGWAPDISEEDALAKLLELNLFRAAASESTSQTLVQRKPRRPTAEQARQQPQFQLPIAGGKQGQKRLAEPKATSTKPEKILKQRLPRKRQSA